jgi:hypothetical protein
LHPERIQTLGKLGLIFIGHRKNVYDDFSKMLYQKNDKGKVGVQKAIRDADVRKVWVAVEAARDG